MGWKIVRVALVSIGVVAGAACDGSKGSGQEEVVAADEFRSAAVRSHDGRSGWRRAVLKDKDDEVVGQATFLRGRRGLISGVISIDFSGLDEGFRGLHIHANDDSDNGKGCIADPDDPPEKHFLSADAHYNPTDDDHGEHAGDLPSVRILNGGQGHLAFVQDLDLDDLEGRAVLLHDHPDNFGHVPVGDDPDEYTPNSDEALELTRTAGHSGHRIACGVIR